MCERRSSVIVLTLCARSPISSRALIPSTRASRSPSAIRSTVDRRCSTGRVTRPETNQIAPMISSSVAPSASAPSVAAARTPASASRSETTARKAQPVDSMGAKNAHCFPLRSAFSDSHPSRTAMPESPETMWSITSMMSVRPQLARPVVDRPVHDVALERAVDEDALGVDDCELLLREDVPPDLLLERREHDVDRGDAPEPIALVEGDGVRDHQHVAGALVEVRVRPQRATGVLRAPSHHWKPSGSFVPVVHLPGDVHPAQSVAVTADVRAVELHLALVHPGLERHRGAVDRVVLERVRLQLAEDLLLREPGVVRDQVGGRRRDRGGLPERGVELGGVVARQPLHLLLDIGPGGVREVRDGQPEPGEVDRQGGGADQDQHLGSELDGRVPSFKKRSPDQRGSCGASR